MLEDESAEHLNILLSHQSFLESIASKAKQNNLIITVVAEKNTGENIVHIESIGMVVERRRSAQASADTCKC